MAASFPTPPVKKPMTDFQPRRGKIKARIFGGIAEAVASAASRARDFLGFIKKDDTSAPATPPPSPRLMVDADVKDGKVLVDFIIHEKDP